MIFMVLLNDQSRVTRDFVINKNRLLRKIINVYNIVGSVVLLFYNSKFVGYVVVGVVQGENGCKIFDAVPVAVYQTVPRAGEHGAKGVGVCGFPLPGTDAQGNKGTVLLPASENAPGGTLGKDEFKEKAVVTVGGVADVRDLVPVSVVGWGIRNFLVEVNRQVLRSSIHSKRFKVVLDVVLDQLICGGTAVQQRPPGDVVD